MPKGFYSTPKHYPPLQSVNHTHLFTNETKEAILSTKEFIMGIQFKFAKDSCNDTQKHLCTSIDNPTLIP